MRAAVASLAAAAALLGGPSPAPAAPPDDVAAYCRAVYPQVQFQVRCLSLENAAAQRVARAQPGGDPDAWARCRGSSPSWSAMEQCLAESARAAAVGGAGAAGVPLERAPRQVTAPGPAKPSEGGAPPTAPPTGAAPPSSPSSAPASAPSPSTVILGPQPTPVLPSERERQTRHISEADAERQLRSVLERNPAARCTKKQYGPGWVITCE
jgi:hypothetical protein